MFCAKRKKLKSKYVSVSPPRKKKFLKAAKSGTSSTVSITVTNSAAWASPPRPRNTSEPATAVNRPGLHLLSLASFPARESRLEAGFCPFFRKQYKQIGLRFLHSGAPSGQPGNHPTHALKSNPSVRIASTAACRLSACK